MTANFQAYREALRQIDAAIGLTEAEKSAVLALGGGTDGTAYAARQKAKLLLAAQAGIYRLVVDDALHLVTDEIYETIAEEHGIESASDRTDEAVELARQRFRAAGDTIISSIGEALLEIEASGRAFTLRDLTCWGDGDGQRIFPPLG